MRICHSPLGMDRLQFAVERVRVPGRQGPADNTDQAVEARRAHVQQVSPFCCPRFAAKYIY